MKVFLVLQSLLVLVLIFSQRNSLSIDNEILMQNVSKYENCSVRIGLTEVTDRNYVQSNKSDEDSILSETSITSLCFAQCSAHCSDRLYKNMPCQKTCDKFTYTDWIQECVQSQQPFRANQSPPCRGCIGQSCQKSGVSNCPKIENDPHCLESCSCSNTESSLGETEYIPEMPVGLKLEQMTATIVRLTWDPPDESEDITRHSVLYVVENMTRTEDWKSFNQLSKCWTEVTMDVCLVASFRVAAVSQFGSQGFSLPVTRSDLPKPEVVTAVSEKFKAFPTDESQTYVYEFQFQKPKDWTDSEGRVNSTFKPNFCQFNPHPPRSRISNITQIGSNKYEFNITIPAAGHNCIYPFKVFLQSPCGMQGVAYAGEVDLRDCNVINGACGPAEHPPPPEYGKENESDTTDRVSSSDDLIKTTSDDLIKTTSDGLIKTTSDGLIKTTPDGTSPGSAINEDNTSLIVAATFVLLFLTTAGIALCYWCFKKQRKQNEKVEKIGLKLDQPLCRYMVDNVLYPAQLKSTTDSCQEVDSYEISRSRITLGEVLGEGAFGQVRKGILKPEKSSEESTHSRNDHWTHFDDANHGDTSVVAVKMLIGAYADLFRNDFLREIEVMKCIGYHENIVSIIACCTVDDPICLLVEHVPCGDLLHYLHNCRPPLPQTSGKCVNTQLSFEDMMSFARQISVGMEFLSRKGFVHRDLATRNILVGENKTIKIGDFGLARYIYDDRIYVTHTGGKLPLKWMAIESIRDLTFTTASDVWSYGIVLFELVTLGGTPYPTINNKELLDELKSGYRMEQPDNCTTELYQIMLACWHEIPESRPSFTQLRILIENMTKSNDGSQLYLNIMPPLPSEQTANDDGGTDNCENIGDPTSNHCYDQLDDPDNVKCPNLESD